VRLPFQEKGSVRPHHGVAEITSDPEAKVSARDAWGLFLGWDTAKVGVHLLYAAMRADDKRPSAVSLLLPSFFR